MTFRQCRVCAVDEAADLIDHALVEACIEPAVDAGVPLLAGYQCTYIICVLRKEGSPFDRMFRFIYRYLEGTDEAFAGVVVGVVVERLEGSELRDELLV